MTKGSSTFRGLQSYGRFSYGIIVSIVFLTLAVRKVDWAKTLSTLGSADLRLIAFGTALLIGTFIVMSFRWRLLLSKSAKVSLKDTFSFIMIGYLANTVLPLRLGDLARAVLLGRRQGISGSLVFGSIMLERVLDVLTILLLMFGLAFVVPIPQLIRTSLFILSFLAVALFGILLAMSVHEKSLPNLREIAPAFLPGRLVELFVNVAVRFAGGLRTLQSIKQLGQAFALTCLAWFLTGLATVVWLKAFHLGTPFVAGFFVLAAVNLGAAIPSSPAAIGVYDYLAMLALSVWVTNKSTTLAYAIGTHGLNILINAFGGALCLGLQGIPLRATFSADQLSQESAVAAELSEG